jgi:hypothetical protein
VRRAEVRPLAIHLGVGVREVEVQPLGIDTRPDDQPALPALLHLPEQLRLDLQVPREVVLARLQHRTRGRGRIAAALEDDALEVRFPWLAVVLVDGVGHLIIHREALDDERAGPDRVQPERVVRFRAAILQDVLRVDRTLGIARETGVPERIRLREGHHGGEVVRRLDRRDLFEDLQRG